MMKQFKFNLGDFVKDKITGYSGVVAARCDYLTGCRRYSLQSKELHEGKPREWHDFDENQLDKIKVKKEKIETDKTKGGPQPKIQRG